MTSENFEKIFQVIKDYIRKENTKMREPIPPRSKFAATIRFLSTGESNKSLSFNFEYTIVLSVYSFQKFVKLY